MNKKIIDTFLRNNFSKIETDRKKQGFSWKPIVIELNIHLNNLV